MMTYIVEETMGFLGIFVNLFLSFFLLSLLANVKFFIKDFSGTIEARSLRLGMQCSNDELYRVRDNGLSQLIFSFILPSLHIGQC